MQSQRGRALPALEGLEGRVVPALITWAHPVSGDWDDVTNWSPNRVPASLDQVSIPYPRITVTHSQAVQDVVGSLNCQASLDVTGGSLEIDGSSTVNNVLEVDNGKLIVGGTLQTDTLQLSGGQTVLQGSTLASQETVQLGGILSGYGTLAASLVNDGVVRPLGGDLTITGDYQQNSDGELGVAVTAPPNTNRLVVQGQAQLDGLLHGLNLQAPAGSTVTDPVLLGNAITGTFSATQLDAGNDTATVTTSAGEVDIVVTAPPPPGSGTGPQMGPPPPAGSTSSQPPPGGGPLGPVGSGMPAGTQQPPPRSPPAPRRPPLVLVQTGISTTQAAKPAGAPAPAATSANTGGSAGGAMGGGAPSGPSTNQGSPGGAGPGGASGPRPTGIVNSGSSAPPAMPMPMPMAVTTGPSTALRDLLFERRGVNGLEDGDEDFTDAFTTTFDLVVSAEPDTALGVEAAVSLLAGGQRAAVLPQRGASVAAVATLLADDDSPRQEEVARKDRGLELLLINPLWKAPVVMPEELLPPDSTPEVGGGKAWWQGLLAPLLMFGGGWEGRKGSHGRT